MNAPLVAASPRTTLLLVDSPGSAAALRSLLDGEPDFEVVGTSRDLPLAEDVLRTRQVDVGVIDVSRPGMDVEGALGRFHQANPGLKIIALLEDRDARRIEAVGSVGVSGHVLKRRAGAELIPAIRHAVASPGPELRALVT